MDKDYTIFILGFLCFIFVVTDVLIIIYMCSIRNSDYIEMPANENTPIQV